MNAPRALVSSCVIEADVLRSHTIFYDAKTEALYFGGKSYNTELVL